MTIKIFPRTEIFGCLECPYYSNDHQDWEPDNFECNNPMLREQIITDNYWWHLQKKKKLKYMPFPSWCPLKTKRNSRRLCP